MIYKRITKKILNNINSSKDEILIELCNTRFLNCKLLNRITNSKCLFKIYGGLMDIQFLPRYNNRIIYSLDEIKKIISCIEKIEKDMPSTKLNKIIYIYDYIRKNITYFPNEKNDLSIRSLRVIITKHAVCSGYSLLFKELLDRQNIKCNYIKLNNHIWNSFCLNRRYYEVDVTWDSCVYRKCNSSNFHFFSNNNRFDYEHHNIKKNNNSLSNNLVKDYKLVPVCLTREDHSKFKLTLLPIGVNKKYYVYEDINNKIIISSDDDFEIIYARGNKTIISSYVNCFFTKERINKYYYNNYSYLGYGVIANKCFYRKKEKKDNYINDIKYKNNCILINNKYLIDSNYNMKEV